MNAESTTSTMRSHTATGLNAQPITPEAMPKIPTMHWKITHTVPAMVPSRISEGLKINEYGMINAGSESPTASHPVFIGGDFASPAAAYAEIATGGVIPENTPKYSANMWLAIVLQPIFISAGYGDRRNHDIACACRKPHAEHDGGQHYHREYQVQIVVPEAYYDAGKLDAYARLVGNAYDDTGRRAGDCDKNSIPAAGGRAF